MLVNWHHMLIQQTLDKVIQGKIPRLIIDIPPGYSKTEMATINFTARGLAINPMAKFLLLSYSDSLALENSSTARAIVQSEAYQKMWSIKLRDDADSKKKWWTEEGGGVYATSAGGQVTGFRAGHMKPGFTGALIIDDPVKPDDADYEERKRVNNRFNETIKSRLAVESVPIIVIMQRIHKMDLAGYLLRGGSGEKWHHLNLPVFSEGNEKYPDEYTHGVEIKYKKDYGWLWPHKHDESHLVELKSHKRRYYCQYMQSPEKYKVEGALWTDEIIKQHRVHKIETELERSAMGVDPSGDDGAEESTADNIGIISACKGTDGHYYVFSDDTRNGSPAQWGGTAVDKYHTHKIDIMCGEENYGGAMVKHVIRTVPNGTNVRYKNVRASRGKLLRAEPIVALYEQGLVHHVGNLYELEEELTTYNGKGKSPGRLDALVWALTELSTGRKLEQSAPEVSLF
jgi:hypothetical protein